MAVNSSVSTAHPKTPAFARRFKPGSTDEVRFTDVKPLVDKAAWSVVALVHPTDTKDYAGIICQRAKFEAGAHHFTFWLKKSAITIESDANTRTSKLMPPINQWSYIGAVTSAESARLYLGTEEQVASEDRPGLVSGAGGGALPISIGRLGNNFAGAIALVCLYSHRLADNTMQALCAGRVDPLAVPGLSFAWMPAPKNDVDFVSEKAGVVTGTELLPYRSSADTAGTNPDIKNKLLRTLGLKPKR